MERWWQTLVRDDRRKLAAADLRGDRHGAVTTSVANYSAERVAIGCPQSGDTMSLANFHHNFACNRHYMVKKGLMSLERD